MLDVVVVGAGAAGLSAAARLQAEGLNWCLIEAGSRIGGRATTDKTTLGFPVDLGCHWLHAVGHNPFVDIARNHSFRVMSGGQDVLTVKNGAVATVTARAAALAYVNDCFIRLTAAADLETDMSVADHLGTDHPHWPLFVRCFLAKQARHPELSSAKDLGRYVWTGKDWPVLDGYGALVAHHWRALPVNLGQRATRIARKSGFMTVTTDDGTMQAKTVILTVSTGVLAKERIVFDPPLPDWKLKAIKSLPMGSANKLALAFTRDVFGTTPSTMLLPDVERDDQVEFVLNPGGHPGAIALINGPFAKNLGQTGTKAMTDFVMTRLGEIFGADVWRHVKMPSLPMIWDAEPEIGGGWATAVPGATEARAALAQPVDDLLFFAGEATSRHYSGDLHGAYFSGIAAAEAVVTALTGRAPTKETQG